MIVNRTVSTERGPPLYEVAIPRTGRLEAVRAHCIEPEEARLLWHQVHGYLGGGLALEPGAVVFDVGANIGLFSLHLAQRLAGRVRCYAFEPAPRCFEALQCNARRFPQSIQPVPCALGRKPGFAELTFYPRSPAWSSLHARPDADREAFRGLMTALLELPEAPEGYRGPDLDRLRALSPQRRDEAVDALADQIFDRPQVSRCTVHTVSGMLGRFGVTRLDLLKVDVEKAELDVLRGIDRGDWKRIRQVAIEVHEIGGRLARVRRLLRRRGLGVQSVEREAALGTPSTVLLRARRA